MTNVNRVRTQGQKSEVNKDERLRAQVEAGTMNLAGVHTKDKFNEKMKQHAKSQS